MSPTDEQIAAIPFEMYQEGAIYYEHTHAHPNSGTITNSSGTYTVSSKAFKALSKWPKIPPTSAFRSRRGGLAMPAAQLRLVNEGVLETDRLIGPMLDRPKSGAS